jgi:hypothetical protein
MNKLNDKYMKGYELCIAVTSSNCLRRSAAHC